MKKETNKRMKQYLGRVKRQVNLPNSMKERVMQDFYSGIEDRRENGMTDEEILTELGTPKEAAAVLNEQMREYTYHKSPWRFLFLIPLFMGAYEILATVISYILFLSLADPFFAAGEAASIGIIGGADGPTAIFITSPDWVPIVVPFCLLGFGILGYGMLSRCKRK